MCLKPISSQFIHVSRFRALGEDLDLPNRDIITLHLKKKCLRHAVYISFSPLPFLHSLFPPHTPPSCGEFVSEGLSRLPRTPPPPPQPPVWHFADPDAFSYFSILIIRWQWDDPFHLFLRRVTVEPKSISAEWIPWAERRPRSGSLLAALVVVVLVILVGVGHFFIFIQSQQG